jgi:tRNA isopentenyl-2-thiomethyl-A-37 hydroxylase MiaE
MLTSTYILIVTNVACTLAQAWIEYAIAPMREQVLHNRINCEKTI